VALSGLPETDPGPPGLSWCLSVPACASSADLRGLRRAAGGLVARRSSVVGGCRRDVLPAAVVSVPRGLVWSEQAANAPQPVADAESNQGPESSDVVLSRTVWGETLCL